MARDIMAIEVKICGLTDEAAATAALEAGADMLGFVFFQPSPRHVEPTRARSLAAPARGRAGVVALTVDATDAVLDDIVATVDPDMLQLHGTETPERAAELRIRYGRPVMKALGVGSAGDVAAAARYAPHVDRILFDAKAPAAATRPGGLGQTFDWRLLAALDLSCPVMLSGGLSIEKLAEALRIARPSGVDVSSGVERSVGTKDPALVRLFIERVRAIEASLEAPERERIRT